MSLNPEFQITRIETAEQTLARELARIDGVQRGRQPYTSQAEAEEREKAWVAFSAEVNTVDEIFHDEITRTEAVREAAEAELANPRLTWTGDQVAECNAHLTAIERDIRTYALTELEPQMRAVLAGQSATQILAWRDALNAQHRALEQAGAPGESRGAVANWALEFDKRVRERPVALSKLKEADKRLKGYRDGINRVHEITRPRRVEAERGRSSAGYTNLSTAPRSMVEMG